MNRPAIDSPSTQSTDSWSECELTLHSEITASAPARLRRSNAVADLSAIPLDMPLLMPLLFVFEHSHQACQVDITARIAQTKHSIATQVFHLSTWDTDLLQLWSNGKLLNDWDQWYSLDIKEHQTIHLTIKNINNPTVTSFTSSPKQRHNDEHNPATKRNRIDSVGR